MSIAMRSAYENAAGADHQGDDGSHRRLVPTTAPPSICVDQLLLTHPTSEQCAVDDLDALLDLCLEDRQPERSNRWTGVHGHVVGVELAVANPPPGHPLSPSPRRHRQCDDRRTPIHESPSPCRADPR
ncbi:hypothetical protein GPOL_c11260 [Gordonia polyisoprenivorans VH2]|uniref:Uncharacterized protein n=1 Tax=Gordonia polyisoprenivorans (strain DSM 44266 / VH2) TaxID=1112204 RepID=H6N1H7_GORPV|nr:hypothetical protein GPOL_c11260 [Gordonia polyisoprenivorans VH2]